MIIAYGFLEIYLKVTTELFVNKQKLIKIGNAFH